MTQDTAEHHQTTAHNDQKTRGWVSLSARGCIVRRFATREPPTFLSDGARVSQARVSATTPSGLVGALRDGLQVLPSPHPPVASRSSDHHTAIAEARILQGGTNITGELPQP